MLTAIAYGASVFERAVAAVTADTTTQLRFAVAAIAADSTMVLPLAMPAIAANGAVVLPLAMAAIATDTAMVFAFAMLTMDLNQNSCVKRFVVCFLLLCRCIAYTPWKCLGVPRLSCI